MTKSFDQRSRKSVRLVKVQVDFLSRQTHGMFSRMQSSHADMLEFLNPFNARKALESLPDRSDYQYKHIELIVVHGDAMSSISVVSLRSPVLIVQHLYVRFFSRAQSMAQQ